MDLLPSSAAGGWLVSELELGWPELFLRANPAAAQRVAAALLRHVPPERLTPRMRAALEAHGPEAAAAEHEAEEAQVRVQLRFGASGAQIRLRFGAGSAGAGAPLPQIEPAPPNQQPDAATTITPATLALSGRPVSPGRESVNVERQVGPAQQRPRRGRQKVKGAAR